MILKVCAFTKKGRALADRLSDLFSEQIVIIREKDDDLTEWIKESFEYRLPIVFVGACGIAVRMIAPFVKDKLTDSAVIVIDEQGRFVIPILSGHIGGANRLATSIATKLGATPVLTTATDINEVLAIDNWADDNGLSIYNREGIATIATKLLEGEKIRVAVDEGIGLNESNLTKEMTIVSLTQDESDILITNDLTKINNQSLILYKRRLCIGIGCKKDTRVEVIEEALKEAIKNIEKEMLLSDVAIGSQIYGIASIDLKAKEYGLNAVAARYGKGLIIYSAKELDEVNGEFSGSDFVSKITGVDNVCERAAMRLAGDSGYLVVKKQARNGVTVAIAMRA